MEVEHTESAVIAPSAAAEVAKANPEKPKETTRLDTTAKPAVATTEKPKTNGTAKDKPEGWDQVDFTPAQQKRFDRLYKQVKKFEASDREKEDILRQQSELIKELHAKQTQVVTHLHEKDFTDAETRLVAQRKEARANGDDDTVDEINAKLAEIRLRKSSVAAQAKAPAATAGQATGQNGQRPQNGAEAARYAASQGQLADADAQIVEAWQEEPGEDGEPLRPWAQASDPEYNTALTIMRGIFQRYPSKPMEEKLAMLDKRMGVERPTPVQEVMGSGQRAGANLTRLNGRGNIGKVQMTDRAANMAVRMKFAGPGKSNDEHIEAYRKQIQQVRGT